MNKITFFLFLLIGSFSFGQKDLTLSNAVMEQYRKFYPEQPVFFQWIPEKTEYTYLKGYVTLAKSSVGAKSDEDWMSIADVNKLAGVKFGWFSGFECGNFPNGSLYPPHA